MDDDAEWLRSVAKSIESFERAPHWPDPERLNRIASRLKADEVTPPMIDAALGAWDASDGDDRGRMWNAIERALEARAAILAMRRAAQEPTKPIKSP